MTKHAEEWAKSCPVCAINGKPERPTHMARVFAPHAVWETIALDFNGPYSKFGGISVLVDEDYRSRYVITKPVKSTSFENTRKILEEVFEKEGFPDNIKSDNGPPFNGEDYRQYCLERGINAIFSTPLYPQQNGLAESCMKLVNKAMTVAATSGSGYGEELDAAIHAYNAAAHSVTGIPPEEVMTGRKIRRGLPLIYRGKAAFDDNARDHKSKIDAKVREDARRGARQCRIKREDTVVVERQVRSKGEPRFDPRRYTVTEERNGMLVLSDENGQTLKRHVSQTRKVYRWRHSEDDDILPECSVDQDFTPQPSLVENPQPSVAECPTRAKRTPEYLKNYIRVVEDEPI
ncbi:uncharacterized protein K02A2.6-like [Wyeomyia smithii]|uniref:uncharacterized protein K02A2.6-like n=1 Tax=Wyeomyia smithii TaxID=174621 RepID=UPI0024680A59|nr:uncharacterized protein K02A2.6-like [Wyeomyia smithii]